MKTLERLLTRKEVAEILGFSAETVRRMTRDGRLEQVPLGRRAIRYREGSVLRMIAAANAVRPVGRSQDERRAVNH